MLDPKTGEVVLSSGFRLGQGVTRTALLRSSLASRATPGTINEPWANYFQSMPPGEVGPFPAEVTLQFKEEALLWISIMNTSPEFGEGWGDWSREKESARQEAHDRWLASSDMSPGIYSFGRVWSVYSDKDALSMITIRYDEALS
jgi:hypothetical protein